MLLDKLTHDRIGRYIAGYYPEEGFFSTWKWSEHSESILPAYHVALKAGYLPYTTGNDIENTKLIAYIKQKTNLEHMDVYKYLRALESGVRAGSIDAELWNPRIDTELDVNKKISLEPLKIFGKGVEKQTNKLIVGAAIAATVIFLGRAYIWKKA